MAERFEPERLAATPTIGYVALAGNAEPVSVAALAELPNLVRLDLAEAAVADVAAVAGFPALHVLSLSARQWEDHLGTGWTPGASRRPPARVPLAGTPRSSARPWRRAALAGAHPRAGRLTWSTRTRRTSCGPTC
ncbi:hypothetical protein [Micromonospora sp. DT47]|uniref:hypothetical protein n=1 Tax=Micromonospora sp. DT47 TaxID=3393431 RepID=UPI003CF5CF02